MTSVRHLKSCMLAAVVTATMLSGGCLDTNVNLANGGWTSASSDKPKAAIDIAKGRLKRDGLDVENYDARAVAAVNVEDCTWVLFDAKVDDKKPRATPAHVAVFIDAAGQATVHRGVE